MALPQNSIGYSEPLEPADVTDEVIDQLHSGVLEDAVFSWATARRVARTPIARLPNRFLDFADDGDLFGWVMR
jgi:hypothetical protein